MKKTLIAAALCALCTACSQSGKEAATAEESIMEQNDTITPFDVQNLE